MSRRIAKLTSYSLLLATGLSCLSLQPAVSYKLSASDPNSIISDNPPAFQNAAIPKAASQRVQAGHTHQMIASDVPMGAPLVSSQSDPLPKPTRPLLSAASDITIKAPQSFVWNTLTDFNLYPQLFPKIESVKVTKRTGNYVYTESFLKPQLFLHQQRQRIVNDLGGKPNVLRWSMLDGNFECTQGSWELTPASNGRECIVKYTLQSTAEPIPRPIAGMTLKMVQKDIVKTFKKSTEKLYQIKEAQARSSPVALNENGGGNTLNSAPADKSNKASD